MDTLTPLIHELFDNTIYIFFCKEISFNSIKFFFPFTAIYFTGREGDRERREKETAILHSWIYSLTPRSSLPGQVKALDCDSDESSLIGWSPTIATSPGVRAGGKLELEGLSNTVGKTWEHVKERRHCCVCKYLSKLLLLRLGEQN